jgi:hypothetical protein
MWGKKFVDHLESRARNPVISYTFDQQGKYQKKLANYGLLDKDIYPEFETMTRDERTKFLKDIDREKSSIKLSKIMESH